MNKFIYVFIFMKHANKSQVYIYIYILCITYAPYMHEEEARLADTTRWAHCYE